MSDIIEKDRMNVTVDHALQIILNACKRPLESENAAVNQTLNRVLAEPVSAQRDVPRFDNSAMDGFVFLRRDTDEASRWFKITGEIRPEDETGGKIDKGTCKRIMTGAPVPEGDIIVVPVEITETRNDLAKINKLPARNPVRKKGEGYSAGKKVLDSGTIIRPYEMALLIESGNRECRVLNPVRIAVQVTGSEINEETDTNGPALESVFKKMPNTSVTRHPVLPDSYDAVVGRLETLSQESDIVLTTGGISMGQHDYILKAMHQLGAEILIRKVMQKPGKPFTVSRLNDCLFFHLPGNPVSCVFTAEFYVYRGLLHLLGIPHKSVKAISQTRLENFRGPKTLFVPGRLSVDQQSRLTVTGSDHMQSHLMQLYHGCNAYIRVEPESSIEPEESVYVYPFPTD